MRDSLGHDNTFQQFSDESGSESFSPSVGSQEHSLSVPEKYLDFRFNESPAGLPPSCFSREATQTSSVFGPDKKVSLVF